MAILSNFTITHPSAGSRGRAVMRLSNGNLIFCFYDNNNQLRVKVTTPSGSIIFTNENLIIDDRVYITCLAELEPNAYPESVRIYGLSQVNSLVYFDYNFITNVLSAKFTAFANLGSSIGDLRVATDSNYNHHITFYDSGSSMGSTTRFNLYTNNVLGWKTPFLITSDTNNSTLSLGFTSGNIPIIGINVNSTSGGAATSSKIAIGNANNATSFISPSPASYVNPIYVTFKVKQNVDNTDLFSVFYETGLQLAKSNLSGTSTSKTFIASPSQGFNLSGFGVDGDVIFKIFPNNVIKFLYQRSGEIGYRVGKILNISTNPVADYSSTEVLNATEVTPQSFTQFNTEPMLEPMFHTREISGASVSYANRNTKIFEWYTAINSEIFYTALEESTSVVVPVGETLNYDLQLNITAVQAISPNVTVGVFTTIELIEELPSPTIIAVTNIKVSSIPADGTTVSRQTPNLLRGSDGRLKYVSQLNNRAHYRNGDGSWTQYNFQLLHAAIANRSASGGWYAIGKGTGDSSIAIQTFPANGVGSPTAPVQIAAVANTGFINISTAVDSGGFIHVAWEDGPKSMGSAVPTVYYSNNISGSWKAPVEVRGISTNTPTVLNQLLIDTANRPLIVVVDPTASSKHEFRYGNTNNATSFFGYFVSDIANDNIDLGSHNLICAPMLGAENVFYTAASGASGNIFVWRYLIPANTTLSFTIVTPDALSVPAVNKALPIMVVGTDMFIIYPTTSGGTSMLKVKDINTIGGATTITPTTYAATRTYDGIVQVNKANNGGYHNPSVNFRYGSNGTAYGIGGEVPTMETFGVRNGTGALEIVIWEIPPSSQPVTISVGIENFELTQLQPQVVKSNLTVIDTALNYDTTLWDATPLVETGVTFIADLQEYTETLLDASVIAETSTTITVDLQTYLLSVEDVVVDARMQAQVAVDVLGYTIDIPDAVHSVTNTVATDLQGYTLDVFSPTIAAPAQNSPNRVHVSGIGKILTFKGRI